MRALKYFVWYQRSIQGFGSMMILNDKWISVKNSIHDPIHHDSHFRENCFADFLFIFHISAIFNKRLSKLRIFNHFNGNNQPLSLKIGKFAAIHNEQNSCMPDSLTPEQRHKAMAAIHSASTKPELKLRHALWRLGFRYRVNVRRLPGSPDIVLPKYRTVIFVHGCFWHGYKDCKNASTPKTNTEF